MTIHEEIAKERFLDLMAAGGTTPELASIAAIQQADVFTSSYLQHKRPEGQKTKGCPRCFGSGGKRNAPCKFCSGIGKVELN